jgi:hypothetical protein
MINVGFATDNAVFTMEIQRYLFIGDKSAKSVVMPVKADTGSIPFHTTTMLL